MLRRSWILILSACLTGCSSVPSLLTPSHAGLLTARQASSLYPLDQGMHWRYRTVSRSGEGPERPGADQVMRVVESEHVLGQVRAVLTRRHGEREFPPTRAVADAKAVTLSRHLKPQDGSISIMSFPLEPGRSWPGRSWGAHAQETISVVGTASIEVPAGRFSTTYLRHRIAYATGLEDTLHYWYAPGVGMVKAVEGLTVDMGSGPVLHQVTAELLEWGNGEASGSKP